MGNRLDVNDLFIIITSRKGFPNTCAAIWPLFDFCLMHLSNVLLSELISDENFIGHKVDLLCNGAITPFWFSSKVLNKKLYLYIERCSLLLLLSTFWKSSLFYQHLPAF